MNPPSSTTRFFGFPLVALVIVLLCGVLVWNWCFGNMPWFIGALALGIAGRTVAAVDEVQRYKTWRKAWNAIAVPAASPAPAKKKFLIPLLFITLVALVLTNRPWLQEHLGAVLSTYIAAAALYVLVGRLGKRRSKEQAASIDKPVAWLIARPSFSPSRGDAIRALPEYSARLLSRS